ncbi:M10 family metallopeptidase C-terminal domain-containing protein [Proteus myxofaciens]|uniref:Hemolysin-type calcium-binding protein n=1 Tax=Proteus myxofaciens ATCC 19692 TaxID=1354337 RepID=A0A198FLC7_9GAMM|nr:M10 family metallopeptidase C-terminal domain-containing protein [Proteus myxofaciens]OAT24986.1 hemolysin-type calcium-binding protein [Proteus myxofaciens ATCC 19692]
MSEHIYKTKNFNEITNKMLKHSIGITWKNYNPQKNTTELKFNFPEWTTLRDNKYKTITTFNEQQKEVARDILKEISSIANIDFTETDAYSDSHLKFGLYNNVNETGGYYSPLIRGFAHYSNANYRLDENKKIKSVSDYSLPGRVWINKSKCKEIDSISIELAIYDRENKKLKYNDSLINRNKNINDRETSEIKYKIDYFNHLSDNINYSLISNGNYYSLYENMNKDIHFNNDVNNPNAYIEKNSYEGSCLSHEILHALGISHTFVWNYSLPYSPENSTKYSIMAYHYPKYEDADLGHLSPSTLLLTDIYIIQKLYGANIHTRKGNTTYGFNANTESDTFHLTNNKKHFQICIWDASGIDTLDFSQYLENQKINLNQGQFSDVGGLRGNVSIAYDTVIEQAIGGYGNDTIIGNEADNFLDGQDGNDYLYGGSGRDILYGGKGNDILDGGKGNDCLYDLYGNNCLYGGDDNDRITSGSGIDTLYGDNGDDHLDPGSNHDFLYGGSGKDTFAFILSPYNYGNNKIQDFNIIEDKLYFYIFKNNKVQKSDIKITDKFSGKTNEAVLNYDRTENQTIISINTREDKLIPNLFITLNGYYSSEDLFLS